MYEYYTLILNDRIIYNMCTDRGNELWRRVMHNLCWYYLSFYQGPTYQPINPKQITVLCSNNEPIHVHACSLH